MEDTEKISFLSENIYVVFVEAESPGNIGFLARAMANFGLKKLVLINPCDLKEESYYLAMHAQEIVENHEKYSSLKEFKEKEDINFLVGTSSVAGGGHNISRIALKPEQLSEAINYSKVGLVFGREGNGLTNKEIELCDILTSIPTNNNYPVMNISHAAAIVFYEIFKNLNEFDVEGIEEATPLEKEFLISDFEEIVKSLEIPKHKRKNGIKVFKNIINRAFITGREAHTLKGILRRVKNKMRISYDYSK